MSGFIFIIIFYAIVAFIIYYKRRQYSKLPKTDITSPIKILENNNKALINSAIEKGMLINFSYVDNKGAKSIRTIKPERFTYSYRDNLCIEGYCFLRKKERHFVVSKMVDITLVNKNSYNKI